MVAYIRNKGKKVISWNPGWKYQTGEIDMTQLWSFRGKAQSGISAIDSRYHYVNHFDIFADLIALYNSRIYNQDMGNEDIAGSILAIWNDRYLQNEKQIVADNNLYAHMLALAERSWRGGGYGYFDETTNLLRKKIQRSIHNLLISKTECFGTRRTPSKENLFPTSDRLTWYGVLQMHFPMKETWPVRFPLNKKKKKATYIKGKSTKAMSSTEQEFTCTMYGEN